VEALNLHKKLRPGLFGAKFDFLCFEFESDAELVSALLEVLAVDQRRQGQGNA
jgi:hypothetical protein